MQHDSTICPEWKDPQGSSVPVSYDDIYKIVQDFKKEKLQHCNFQLWYPDEISEEMFYKNEGTHGVALSNIFVDRDKEAFLKQLYDECETTPSFNDMSAIKFMYIEIEINSI
jgi:hypothetical protein